MILILLARLIGPAIKKLRRQTRPTDQSGRYQPGPYQPGPYQPGPYQPGPYQQGPYQPGPADWPAPVGRTRRNRRPRRTRDNGRR